MKTTEEWHRTEEGMTSTVVVIIQDDDTVHVADNFLNEFQFETERGQDITMPHEERLGWAFPVEYIRERLEATGWVRSDDPAA